MQKLLFSFLVLWTCVSHETAAQPTNEWSIVGALNANQAHTSEFDQYEINLTETFQVFSQLKSELKLRLQFGDQEDQLFYVIPNEVRSDGYLIRTNDGVYSRGRPYVKTFKGVSADGQDELRLTIDEQFIEGYFTNQQEVYFIEQVRRRHESASANLITISSDEANTSFVCGSDIEFDEQTIYRNNPNDSCGIQSCIQIKSALANDYVTYIRKNSDVNEVENFNLSVLNTVQPLYDDEFNEEVNLTISEIYISTTEEGDVWGDEMTSSLVRDFAAVVDSVFTTEFNIASLWVWRLNTADGVAINSVCDTRIGVNILKSTFSGNRARVIQAHELGHNFGANHDTECCHVMFPSTQSSATTWSERSQFSINRTLERCFFNHFCEGYLKPEIGLMIDDSCAPSFAEYEDLSNSDMRCWTFEDGDIEYSNEKMVIVGYDEAARFSSVYLEVSDSLGRSSRTMKLVTIEEFPDATMFPGESGWEYPNVSFSSNCFGISTWHFGDGNSQVAQFPFYTYSEPGIYTVTHICQNICGVDSMEMVFDFSMSRTIDANFFDDVVVFPNPADEQLYIKYSTSQSIVNGRMYNLQGEELISFQSENPQLIHRVNLPHNLVSGIYLLEAQTESNRVIQKIYVER